MVWRCGHYSMTLGSPDTPLPLRSPKGTRGASVVLFHSLLHTFHYPIPLLLYSHSEFDNLVLHSCTFVLRIQCARSEFDHKED